MSSTNLIFKLINAPKIQKIAIITELMSFEGKKGSGNV